MGNFLMNVSFKNSRTGFGNKILVYTLPIILLIFIMPQNTFLFCLVEDSESLKYLGKWT